MILTNTNVQSSDSCVFLSWPDISVATGYNIYINGKIRYTLSGYEILGRVQKHYFIDSGNTYSSDIIGKINGFTQYYSIEPYNNIATGVKTADYYIMPFNAYDNINYTPLPQFTPLNLNNIIGWYDSAEKNNVIRDWGGGVLRINNKVSSNYPLVTSSTLRPLYRNGYTGTANSYDPNYTYSTNNVNGTYVYCIPNSYFTAQNLDISRTDTFNSNIAIAIVYTSKNTTEKALWGSISGNNNRYQRISSANSPTTNGTTNVNVGSSLNTTNPTLYVGIYNTSTNSQVRVNGQTQVTFTEISSNTLPIKQLQINADGSGGSIGEMLLHECIILKGSSWTMRDIYMLEGYLGSKWNLLANFSSAHPYKYIKPTIENNLTPVVNNNYIEYDPLNSTSIIIWYDTTAADSYKTTSVINSVLSSTYTMNITGATTYVNSGNNSYIQFSTSSYSTIPNLLLPRPEKYLIAIIYTTSTSNHALWSTDNNGWDRLQATGSAFGGYFTFGNGVNGGTSFNTITDTTNNRTLYVGVLTGGIGSQIRINGSELIVTSTGLNSFTEDSTYQSSSAFTFNALGGSNGGNIKLHEMIVLKGDSWSFDDVYKIESYLGNKWGLKGNFPYRHPYRYNPAIIYGSIIKPPSPAVTNKTATTTTITVSFNTVQVTNKTITSYVLTDISSNKFTTSTISPITITGLTANTLYSLYFYTVDSTNTSSDYVIVTQQTTV